ncbi:MAG: HNH endonuclease signature motif containing protein [Limnohabitans sp.]
MLTAERLRELVHYEPATGVFTRLKSTSRRASDAGKRIGSPNVKNGFMYASIGGKLRSLPRMAVLYMTGEEPDAEVSYVDGDKGNLRWANLVVVRRFEIWRRFADRTGFTPRRGLPKDSAAAYEEASRVLRLDAETGFLYWKAKPQQYSRAVVGERACRDENGLYRRVCINGVGISAHRIVWLLTHGDWPAQVIDHINGDSHDNRASNLRDVDIATNSQNVRGATARSSTGLLGAYVNVARGCFNSSITVNGVTKNLGRFDTAEAAHDAYIKAKRKLHAGCTI